MTAIARKLLNRESVNVESSPGYRFTIIPVSPAGFSMVRGYRIVKGGRAVRSPILSREQVIEWAADLTEVS